MNETEVSCLPTARLAPAALWIGLILLWAAPRSQATDPLAPAGTENTEVAARQLDALAQRLAEQGQAREALLPAREALALRQRLYPAGRHVRFKS